MHRSTCGLALLLALGLAPAAEQAKLKPKPLPTPPLTLTADDIQGETLLDGKVRSPLKLEFKNNASASQKVTVGPLAFDLALRGSGVKIELGGKSLTLKAKGDQIRPTLLPMPDGGQFALTFPIVDRGRTTTAIYMRNGFLLGGRLGRDTILFYDSNQNGALDTADGYCSGRTPLLFAPIKQLILGDRGLYSIEGFSQDEKYSYADYLPYEGETAAFEIKTASRGAELMAVFSKSDDSLAFATEGKSDDFEVPPGDYQLSYGMVLGRNGNDQIIAARIETGEFQPVTVGAEGGEAIIGGPYTLRFEANKTTSKGKPVITISPRSLRLFGANGEEYREFDYKNLPVVTLETGRKPTSLGSFEYG